MPLDVEPEGDDEEPLVEPDVPPLVEPDVPLPIEPEAEPLAEPEAPAEPAVEVSVLPLALEALEEGDVVVLVVDGVVVAVEPEDGVVAVDEAPVPEVDVLLAGRSQPVANAAASARAAVSEISFMSSPWFGG